MEVSLFFHNFAAQIINLLLTNKTKMLMKQILRYSLVALFSVMGFGNAMAENVIWQENWTGWTEQVKGVLDGVNPNYTFTGTVLKDDGTFKSGTTIYNENLAGGEAPELLVAKNGGSFTATVALGGKSGDMTLSFKCNKNIPVEVTGGTIGENAGSGNDYVYPISGASGTLTIKFNNSTSANARLDNIKLFQGEGKKPAGLSWGTSARTVTIGADDNIFPTLSNENNLAVTYNSSETSVATIAADGTITLVTAGTTVITASSEETAEFEAGHAQYTLTVKEAQGGGGGEEQIEQITVAKALEIAGALADNGYSDKEYQIKGFVVGTPAIDKKNDGTFYGNAKFYMADTKGGTETIYAYQIYGLNGEKMESEDYLKENDEVIVQGKLQKYVKGETTTLEIAKGGKIVSLNGKTGINNITADQLNSGAVYNVAGQMVTDSYKGLVIKNGKKTIQK